MEDGSLPSYLFIVLIILIMVFNGLVVACKRALDYIDRNVIKDRLEDKPEDRKLQTVKVSLRRSCGKLYQHNSMLHTVQLSDADHRSFRQHVG